MAATTTVNNSHVPGDRKRVSFTLAGDTSYPTGGYPIPTAAQLNLSQVTDLQFTNYNAVASASALAAADYVVNNTTNKVQLITPAGIEVAAAVNVSAFSIDGIAEGF